MRFACLGSGSKGNAWLVRGAGSTLMLDCGFGLRETLRRLERFELPPERIDAVLLTHEHSDHMRGVAAFSRHFGTRVCLTHGCAVMLASMDEAPVNAMGFDSQSVFQVGGLEIRSYPVPHDAREPVQYVISDGQRRFGLLTDAGHVTGHMEEMLHGCHALALECNHDTEMLRAGRYPVSLKRRILGRYGHLDNDAAATLLGKLRHTELRHVVAAHLSEENNTPDLARASLAAALDCDAGWIAVADQEAGLAWREI